MTPLLLLAVYSLVVIAASLAGGWLPLAIRLTHVRLQMAMSFVGGAMLGVSLLHLVPHAVMGGLNVFASMGWLLGGFLAMFFLERALPFHHHDVHHHAESGHGGQLEQAAGGQGDAACARAAHTGTLEASASQEHSVSHHDHAGQGEHFGHVGRLHVRRSLTWGAALAGLSLHSALDGMALAASTTAEHAASALAGMGVFLAVVLHKPFDALTLGTLLAVAGSTRRLRHLVNAGYSLAVPAGALLFLLASRLVSDRGASITAPALAFAAGMFLCIAAADLLPELHFHAHDRIKLSVALVLGLALAAGIVAWEEMYHDHQDHPAEHATEDSAAHRTSRRAAAHERWTLASACRVQAGCGPDALFQPACAANGGHQLENLVDQLVLSPHGHGLLQRAPHQQAQARTGRQQV